MATLHDLRASLLIGCFGSLVAACGGGPNPAPGGGTGGTTSEAGQGGEPGSAGAEVGGNAGHGAAGASGAGRGGKGGAGGGTAGLGGKAGSGEAGGGRSGTGGKAGTGGVAGTAGLSGSAGLGGGGESAGSSGLGGYGAIGGNAGLSGNAGLGGGGESAGSSGLGGYGAIGGNAGLSGGAGLGGSGESAGSTGLGGSGESAGSTGLGGGGESAGSTGLGGYGAIGGTGGTGGQTDPCAVNNGGCDVLTTCTNDGGNRACGACPRGYTGSGDAGCVPKLCSDAPDPDCACIKVTPDGDDASALASHGRTPFSSVQAALDFASAHPEVASKVCVAGGPDCDSDASYPGPTAADLTMHDGVSLYGSYESTGFTRCDAQTTTLAPMTATGVLFANDITRGSTLDGFQLVHFDATATTAISIRAAKGVVVSTVDIDGGGSAMDVYGVDVSNGADATLRDVTVSLPLPNGSQDPLPSGNVYGIRAIGAQLTVSSSDFELAGNGSGVYGVWLENATGAVVQNSTFELDSLAGPITAIHVAGTGATLFANNMQLAVRSGPSTIGTELVDAPNTTLSVTLTANGANNSGLTALRSTVDASVAFTLRGGTGVLLDTSPGSAVHGSVMGQAGYSATGVQVTGSATGTVIHDLTVSVENGSALTFADCGGAAPLVTGSSLRSTSNTLAFLGTLDTLAANGNCQPQIQNNSSIVASVVLPRVANGVHCNNGSLCTLSNNADIHLELQVPSVGPGYSPGAFTVAGINCETNNCGDIIGNHVSGLSLPQGYYQGRDTVIRGNGIIANTSRIAKNVVSAGCTGQGAGIKASGGRIENNFVYGPTCGAGYLDNPATGAALEISGPADVNSNTLFGGAASYYGPAGYIPCSGAGVRFHAVLFANSAIFRDNIIGNSGTCPGADFVEVEATTYGPGVFQNNDLLTSSYLDNGTTQLSSIAAVNALGDGYSGNFSANPGFAPDNMHLSGNSPCINAGTPTGAPPDDFDGAPRDSQPDVGADEWDGLIPPNPCTFVTCSGHGTCNAVQGAAVCTCSQGYVGSDCSSPNLCVTSNGGCDPLTTCTPFPGGRTCGACPQDYSGTGESGCTPIGCVGNPCQNGGVCTPAGGSNHTCACPPGISGANCEHYFTALSAGDGFTCGLRNDAQIVCFGRDDQGQTDVPAGNYLHLSAGKSTVCAERTDLSLVCWGDGSQGLTSPPSGVFTSLSVGDNSACALNGSTPTCWGAMGPAPGGQFRSLTVGAWHACGIQTSGTVACWGLDDNGQASPPPDGFDGTLSLSATTSCGIRSEDDAIVCWGADNFGGTSPPSGLFSEVHINDSTACALTRSSVLVCSGTDPALPDNLPNATLTALTVGAHHACGVFVNALYCWGDNTYGELTPPP